MRIVIAEDSVLLRAGLTRILADAGEDVVATVGDADELLRVVRLHLPDLAIVDASHEEEDVYQDLCNYWEVAADNGFLFGDDYSWDGVRLAVERFAREEKRKVSFAADKWILRKNA